MEKLREELNIKVLDCHNTTTIFDTNKYVKLSGFEKLEQKLIEAREEAAKLKKQLEEVKEKANHLLHLHACEQEGLSSGQPSFMDWMKATSELSEVLTKTEE